MLLTMKLSPRTQSRFFSCFLLTTGLHTLYLTTFERRRFITTLGGSSILGSLFDGAARARNASAVSLNCFCEAVLESSTVVRVLHPATGSSCHAAGIEWQCRVACDHERGACVSDAFFSRDKFDLLLFHAYYARV